VNRVLRGATPPEGGCKPLGRKRGRVFLVGSKRKRTKEKETGYRGRGDDEKITGDGRFPLISKVPDNAALRGTGRERVMSVRRTKEAGIKNLGTKGPRPWAMTALGGGGRSVEKASDLSGDTEVGNQA